MLLGILYPLDFLTMKCGFFWGGSSLNPQGAPVRNLHWTHWDVRTMWCQTAWNWKWWTIVGRWFGQISLGLMDGWMVMGPGWEKWWEKCIICHIEKHTWMVDSYGIIVGKYTHFPMDPIGKYHFLTYSNDAQAGAGLVSWACFFLGGGRILVIHWNQPTHLWGVAWLTCLWSPLVCITRCFFCLKRDRCGPISVFVYLNTIQLDLQHG